MIKYCVPESKRAKIFPTIDSIYHCISWQDMWMKIDLNGFKVDRDAFMLLCNTLCYHYGFWPHTKARFLAFKKFLKLKKPNPLSRVKLQKNTLEAVKAKAEWLETEIFIDPTKKTPGRLAEMRAWKSIQHILERCQIEEKVRQANGKQR